MNQYRLIAFCFAILLISPVSNAENSNFKIACHVQDYLCYPENPGHCVWGTLMGHEKEFNLTKNPSYPNPGYPNEVWEGELEDTLHYSPDPSKYKLKVKVVVTPDGQKNYRTSLEYHWNNWLAYGQGLSAVGAGIIDQSKVDKEHLAGRGYYCWGAEFSR